MSDDPSSDKANKPSPPDRAFTAALDREGYSFHHAVLRHIAQAPQHQANVRFEVSELPVPTLRDGRIDFILTVKSQYFTHPRVLLVCECKRSNPALNAWCFARAPYIRNLWLSDGVFAEEIFPDRVNAWAGARTMVYKPNRDPYHIGLPVKSGEQGDCSGSSGRDVIEHSCGQVIAGLNGFADFLNQNLQLFNESQPYILLPVIFTTANLFASNVDFGGAGITDGKLTGNAQLERLDWLWFQSHVSGSLRHHLRRGIDRSKLGTLSSVLDQDHVRSIAIVSPSGIDEFLHAARDCSMLFNPRGE